MNISSYTTSSHFIPLLVENRFIPLLEGELKDQDWLPTFRLLTCLPLALTFGLSRKKWSSKKFSGQIKIAGVPIPPENFFLKKKRVIWAWRIDAGVNMYHKTQSNTNIILITCWFCDSVIKKLFLSKVVWNSFSQNWQKWHFIYYWKFRSRYKWHSSHL